MDRNPGPRSFDIERLEPITQELLEASDKMLSELEDEKKSPLTLSEILAALMERFGDRVQPRTKPNVKASAHQAHRKLLNRFNRAIRQSKQNGRQNLSKLLQQRNQVIQHMRYDLHQKQRKINDALFQKDKYDAYNKVINPQDPTSPGGSKEDAETFLHTEFSTHEDPSEPFNIPHHTPTPVLRWSPYLLPPLTLLRP